MPSTTLPLNQSASDIIIGLFFIIFLTLIKVAKVQYYNTVAQKGRDPVRWADVVFTTINAIFGFISVFSTPLWL